MLIGDSAVDLSLYRTVPNMHFLGRRPYADLPAYCKGLDVGLIPFKINDLTRAVNPIKLREYLAAGLPVVSTPLPEVLLYTQVIKIGDTPRGSYVPWRRRWRPLERDSRRVRRAAMAQETWLEKVEAVCQHLGQPIGVGDV